MSELDEDQQAGCRDAIAIGTAVLNLDADTAMDIIAGSDDAHFTLAAVVGVVLGAVETLDEEQRAGLRTLWEQGAQAMILALPS